jgi:hypothetical protein
VGRGRWLPVAGLAAVLLYGGVASLLSDDRFESATAVLDHLDARDRAAMAWVTVHTPPDARVLVVSGEPWYADRYSEWFPVLAARHSVATAQGYEWLPAAAFQRQKKAFNQAQACAHAGAECLDRWEAPGAGVFTHLYVPKADEDCCAALARSLASDPRWVLAYDGPGARVFARRGR